MKTNLQIMNNDNTRYCDVLSDLGHLVLILRTIKSSVAYVNTRAMRTKKKRARERGVESVKYTFHLYFTCQYINPLINILRAMNMMYYSEKRHRGKINIFSAAIRAVLVLEKLFVDSWPP